MKKKLLLKEKQLLEMRNDVKKLGATLLQYLKENGTPYTEISVTQDGIEVKQTIIGLLSEEIQYGQRDTTDNKNIQDIESVWIPEKVRCDAMYMVLGNLNEAAQFLEQEDYESALLETYAAWQKILEFKINAAIQS